MGAYISIHPPVLTMQLRVLALKKMQYISQAESLVVICDSFNSTLRWKEKQITGRGKKSLLEAMLEQHLAPVSPNP